MIDFRDIRDRRAHSEYIQAFLELSQEAKDLIIEEMKEYLRADWNNFIQSYDSTNESRTQPDEPLRRPRGRRPRTPRR